MAQKYTSDYPPFFVTVDLVILTTREDGPAVLLVRRGGEPFAGRWALPGGFVDIDEDLGDAAYRELQEETGIGAGSVRLEQIGAFGEPGRDPRGRMVSTAYVAVGADLPEAASGSDASDARWWPLGQARELDLAFDHGTILEAGVERAGWRLSSSSS